MRNLKNGRIKSSTWKPECLLKDLQEMIDEMPDSYTNTDRVILETAKAYLSDYFRLGIAGSIILKTRMRRIPKTCKECSLSVMHQYHDIRVCSVMDRECPIERKESGNYGYGKPVWCPLMPTTPRDT